MQNSAPGLPYMGDDINLPPVDIQTNKTHRNDGLVGMTSRRRRWNDAYTHSDANEAPSSSGTPGPSDPH